MTIQRDTQPELSAEQIAIRQLIFSFKNMIKTDAFGLRKDKREIRELQRQDGSGAAASLQCQLSVRRVEARARLLIYGTLRGRSWDRMEPKHSETNARLAYYVTRVWNAAKTSVPMPEQIKVFK